MDKFMRSIVSYGDISIRILDDYNRKKKTDFVFDESIRDNLDDYVKSGIMTVLVTSHIPK